jgi:hypothetical protein
MDTIFVVPIVAHFFLFTLFISSFFAGLILSISISKAGYGWFLCLGSFIIGVCIHVGCMYVSIRYFNAFGQHVFMIQFISLAIIIAIASAIYNILIKYF